MRSPHLPHQDPDARFPACCNLAPDWRGLRATIEVDEVETPFGVLNGRVEIGGEDDGGWHVIECSVPLDWPDSTYVDWRVVSNKSSDRFERTIAKALIGYVTDDMATDALVEAMGE